VPFLNSDLSAGQHYIYWAILRKNMKRILIFILLSLAISAPACAAASATTPATKSAVTPPPHSTTADTNHWLYVGAQLGDSVVGGLLGLQINKMYSVEVRYDYTDTVYLPNNTVKSSSTGIAGVAMFPLKLTDMEPFFVFAKVGYERTKVESTTTDPGIPGFFDPTTTVTTTVRKRVTVGAGAQYDFTRNVSGRIGWNAIGSDHSANIAAIYKF
jgi:opacity protein-like surface antigen